MWLFAPLAIADHPSGADRSQGADRLGLVRAGGAVGGARRWRWAASAAAPAYSADRQQRFAIEHITDTTANKSYWAVSTTARHCQAGSGRALWERRKLPYSERMRWLTKAPPIPGIKPPTAEPVADPIAIEKGKPRTRTILLHMQRRRQHRAGCSRRRQHPCRRIDGFVRPFDKTAKGRPRSPASGAAATAQP